MSPQKSAELIAFMASCDLAAVSYLSSEGTPQSAVMGIAVTPELEILFDTMASSRKCGSLKACPHCAVVMWTGEATIQFEGIAEETAEDRYKDIYFQKMPDGRDRLSWPGITYFVVRPKWIRYSDFGTHRRMEEYFFD